MSQVTVSCSKLGPTQPFAKLRIDDIKEHCEQRFHAILHREKSGGRTEPPS
jgi:hypothetical protein